MSKKRVISIWDKTRWNKGKRNERFRKEYKQRIKQILKSNLNSRNAISPINIWAVAVMRDGAGVVNWTEEELEKLDRQTDTKNYDNE